jgi:hypothetical protein
METMVTAFLDAKCIVRHSFVLKKQTVARKFYEEANKRLIHRVRSVRPEFQESVSRYILHDNASANSLGILFRILSSYFIDSPDLAGLSVFYHKLEIPVKVEIRDFFIDPADCEQRNEADKGRSVFSGIQFVIRTKICAQICRDYTK